MNRSVLHSSHWRDLTPGIDVYTEEVDGHDIWVARDTGGILAMAFSEADLWRAVRRVVIARRRHAMPKGFFS
ncbi:MAG: hypothetical protein JWM93_1966 [Frankiales bacterium]|nr:hypothetical protein [Frankiales bacterium]